MHSIEQQLCNSTLNTIKSPELAKINYIFMEPVEVSYFPDYLEFVKKPMDLTTLTTNLNNKLYANFKEFFQDASLIHHNARIYHKDRSETQYILKLADALEKVLKKEEKRVKKTLTRIMEKREKKKERKAQAKAQSQAQASDKSNTKNGTLQVDTSINSSVESEPTKEKGKKPSLKLKLSSRSKVEPSSGSAKILVEESTSGSKTKDPTKRGKSEKNKQKQHTGNSTSSSPPSSLPSKHNAVTNQSTPKHETTKRESGSSIETGTQLNPSGVSKKGSNFALKINKQSKEKNAKSSKLKMSGDQEKITAKKAKSSSKTIKPKLKLRLGMGSNKKGNSVFDSNATKHKAKKETKRPNDNSTKKQSSTEPKVDEADSPKEGHNTGNTLSISKKMKSKVKLSIGVKKSNKSSNDRSDDKQSKNQSISKSNHSASNSSHSQPSRGKELPSSVSSKRKVDGSTSNIQTTDEDKKNRKSSKSSSSTSETPMSNTAPSKGKELPKTVTSSKREKSESSKLKQSSESNKVEEESRSKIRLNPPSRGKEIPKSASTKQTTSSESNNGKTGATASSGSGGESSSKRINLVFGKKNQSLPKISVTKSSSTLTSSSTNKKAIVSSKPLGNQSYNIPITETQRIACSKVLSGLKRREPINSSWFLYPQSDPRILDDYKAKIRNPMDLGRVASKIDKNEYPSVDAFVRDIRRIFANCLCYNTDTESNLRPAALQMLIVAENLMVYFIGRHEDTLIYPPLLYNWKKCLDVLNKILEIRNPDDKLQTAHFFLHPVSFYFNGEWPSGYLSTIKTPMDLGTVVSKLIEGDHQSVSSFVSDCKFVWENCIIFNGEKEASLTEKAERLKRAGNDLLQKLMDQDLREDKETKSLGYHPTPVMVPVQESFLLKMLQDLRMTTYTDRRTKFTESATVVFEKPVDTNVFTDYLEFVESPMNLETVEQKIKNEEYQAPEDFEYDVLLIFKNCEKYNIPKKNDLIVAKAKHCATKFRKLYSGRMKIYLESGGGKHSDGKSNATSKDKSKGNEEKRDKKRSKSPHPDVKSNKRLKLDQKGSKSTKKPKLSTSTPKNAPQELFAAINHVKEGFAPRRNIKELEAWEISCYKIMQALLQHPWLRARNARPKFNFHAPVPMVYPEVKVAYAEKIKNPMDLTTVEAKLMQGGHYTSPQQFVDEVALIFENGIIFNETGRVEGEPIACSYYDASKHLIRYTRWLSLDHLSTFLMVEERNEDVERIWGAATHWELTNINHEDSKKEMEELVMKETMVKSDLGDRFSWMESECEKLLKALRRVTDGRLMTYFICLSQYPPDYSAFVSKPMSWEKVNNKLNDRMYNTLGEVVEDLRLIFSNALKYNFRAKGTDTVSGKAYDAAVTMSAKLEVAIDSMLLSVSDRLERDKIDKLTVEREADALERANEERAHAARMAKRENGRESTGEKSNVVTYKTVKVIQAKQPERQQLDFHVPLYEEEDSHRERSQGEAQRQRQLFEAIEKQERLHIKMQRICVGVGVEVYARMAERQTTLNNLKAKWKEYNTKALEEDLRRTQNQFSTGEGKELHLIPTGKDSKLSLLSGVNRPKVVMSLKATRRGKKRKSIGHLILEEF